jgi:hypothetical protein
MSSATTFRTAATLKANGATYVAIGKELGVSDKTAKVYVTKGQDILEQEAKQAKKAPKRTASNKGRRKEYDTSVTEQVIYLRENQEQSWAKIAEELDLGSPSKARRVYRNAKGIETGLPLGRFENKGGRLADRKPYAEKARQAGLVAEGDYVLNQRLVEAYRDAKEMNNQNA